ncbi:hypothetical protein OPU71_07015 [Niveibacterium sp. 24ML]|uniref:hypothetical protein n=1 Tax=Niveibacterium sp. 24ML TaxID=2985512 RepID=UPI00226F9DD7|nr:hypothetical protein [Niveibacterium sp. 24ML]MCX9155878.1 hypothetical protein [Niveibacterium sp. 24ML]
MNAKANIAAPKPERVEFGMLAMSQVAPFEVRDGLPVHDLLEQAYCYLSTAETLTYRVVESIENEAPDAVFCYATSVQLELASACVYAAIKGTTTGREPQVAAASQSAAPDLLSELQKAHLIIRNALQLMTPEQKSEWGKCNEADGVSGDGITRANERLAVIERVAGGES